MTVASRQIESMARTIVALREGSERLEQQLQAVTDDRDYYRSQRDRWRDKANTHDLAELTRVAWLEHDLREARAVLTEILAHEESRSRGSGHVGHLARRIVGA